HCTTRACFYVRQLAYLCLCIKASELKYGSIWTKNVTGEGSGLTSRCRHVAHRRSAARRQARHAAWRGWRWDAPLDRARAATRWESDADPAAHAADVERPARGI